MEVGSFARRVMWVVTATRILPITDRHSLFPSSFTRTPIGLPCGWRSCCQERYGLTTFRLLTGMG